MPAFTALSIPAPFDPEGYPNYPEVNPLTRLFRGCCHGEGLHLRECLQRPPPTRTQPCLRERCAMPVHFCRQCNNMLYPKEDTQKRRTANLRELVYACRNCDHKEPVEVSRDPVYRNVLTHDASYVFVALPSFLWGF